MGTLISGLVWLFVVLPVKLLVLCLHVCLVWPLKLLVGGAKLIALPFKMIGGLGKLILLPFKAIWWVITLPFKLLAAPFKLIF